MFSGLIEEAHKEGCIKVSVAAMIENKQHQLLLIEDLKGGKPIYGFPSAEIQEGETIQQALQRAVTLQANMGLKETLRYVGHYDLDGERVYHFVVAVNDPYAIEEKKEVAHAWLIAQEAVGYPILDEVRQMLDQYDRN